MLIYCLLFFGISPKNTGTTERFTDAGIVTLETAELEDVAEKDVAELKDVAGKDMVELVELESELVKSL